MKLWLTHATEMFRGDGAPHTRRKALAGGRGAILVGVILLTCNWLAYFDQQGQLAASGRLAASLAYPQVLAGTRLDVARHAIEVDGTGGLDSPARVLLLAVDDGCPQTRQALSQWRALIDTVATRPGVEVWILTFGGRQVADELLRAIRGRSGEGRIWRVDDASTFAVRTGIVSVPFMAILDRHHAVHMVGRGYPTAAAIDAFARDLTAGQSRSGG